MGAQVLAGGVTQDLAGSEGLADPGLAPETTDNADPFGQDARKTARDRSLVHNESQIILKRSSWTRNDTWFSSIVFERYRGDTAAFQNDFMKRNIPKN